MNRYEFLYAFQLSKKIIFEVDYYTLGSNENPYFSMSAAEFNQPKSDYSRCGQCQEDLCTGLALEFVNKWDYLHLRNPSDNEYREILEDIEDLKNKYNYIEIIDEEGFGGKNSNIGFNRIKELSKLEPKSKIK